MNPFSHPWSLDPPISSFDLYTFYFINMHVLHDYITRPSSLKIQNMCTWNTNPKHITHHTHGFNGLHNTFTHIHMAISTLKKMFSTHQPSSAYACYLHSRDQIGVLHYMVSKLPLSRRCK